MSTLPDDILYMICRELWHERDFNTLFNCACSTKQLALPALYNIYRMHDVAPVTNGGSDEEIISVDRIGRMRYRTKATQEKALTMKWARLWQTIVLSSLGKTLYPYSQYIRTLNLQDLMELFEDNKFTDGVSRMFFKGDLAEFRVEKLVVLKGPGPFQARPRLDAVKTAHRIGEVITKKSPLLEELTGLVRSEDLSRWIPQSPRLKRLNLWHGEAIVGNGNLIRLHCPSFKTLKIWSWSEDDEDRDGVADHDLGTFLNDLRPQSLESFETYSYCGIGTKSLLALNCHGQSLTELKLNRLLVVNISQISMLKGCTNLVSLSLGANGIVFLDLEHSHKDVFLETIEWLKECKKLHTISFFHFPSAAALMTPILLENSIRLTKLEFEGYSMLHNRAFHQALANQTGLQSLWLKAETDEDEDEEIEVLVESLTKLTNLTDLQLRDISEFFRDEHILRLAHSLPKLEVWWTGGYYITDAIWPYVASLSALRRLDLAALTTFTAKGILDFIQELGPGNRGLVLAVMNAEMDSNLSQQEQALIQDSLAAKVKGRFEFTLTRDPEISSFEGDSD